MSNELRCPVCESTNVHEFLTRRRVPVHQNLLMRDHAAAVSVERGDLALTVCDHCGFIFNRAFDPQKILYGEDYENNQGCSGAFNDYLDGLVRHLLVDRDVRHANIVEVGCGNGAFLRKLISDEKADNKGFGFDPSHTGPDTEFNGRLTFDHRYYDSACATLPADVIICRHVIEHVQEPMKLLGSIREAVVDRPNARLFFETPCVEWILRNEVIWDFFYEHCSYFTAQSLTTAFQLAGFEVQEVQHVFGGQYLWLEASVAVTKASVDKGPGEVVALAESFARSELTLKRLWAEKIRELAANEKVALWGAGAKGVTFANLIDETNQWLDCVVDLNPLKQGRFIPGTGHPIVDYRELSARNVTSAILMNPEYRAENEALLKQAEADVRLIEKP